MKLGCATRCHAPHTSSTSAKKAAAKAAMMTTKRLRSRCRDVGRAGAAAMAAMRPIWQWSPTATTTAVPEPSVTAAPMKAMLRASRELVARACRGI